MRPDHDTRSGSSFRPVGPIRLISWSRGRSCCFMSVNGQEVIAAMDAALTRLCEQGRRDDLVSIEHSTGEDLWRWSDRLAAEFPDDARWDTWRTYRKQLLSNLN